MNAKQMRSSQIRIKLLGTVPNCCLYVVGKHGQFIFTGSIDRQIQWSVCDETEYTNVCQRVNKILESKASFRRFAVFGNTCKIIITEENVVQIRPSGKGSDIAVMFSEIIICGHNFAGASVVGTKADKGITKMGYLAGAKNYWHRSDHLYILRAQQ
ncbi:ribonuclease P, putative [Babesia ovata]|uniref:Ribonuclease P, putative n=1 Tax=Babesia ovata TaxID=189622 RepID=A0A2H6KI13_9APIC|nr:ribonuclease P, putative [Babesia ovata]GBE62636.1 ribonuclease P, putative [Babesia ovata]